MKTYDSGPAPLEKPSSSVVGGLYVHKNHRGIKKNINDAPKQQQTEHLPLIATMLMLSFQIVVIYCHIGLDPEPHEEATAGKNRNYPKHKLLYATTSQNS